MKPKTDKMWWRNERDEAGTREALLDRVKFHGTVRLDEAAKLMGLSIQTVRKHAKMLYDEGKATLYNQDGVEYLTLRKVE